MKCSVCGGDQFVASQYKMESGFAPALECTRCRALNLDEAVAHSKQDLDSVRMAVAARAASVLDSDSSEPDELPRAGDPQRPSATREVIPDRARRSSIRKGRCARGGGEPARLAYICF